MDKPLRREAAEQPLHDALFEVQVDDVVVQRAGVLEDDRPERRGAPPFPHGLVPPPGRAQGVQGVGPGGIGPVPLVEGREDEPLRPRSGPVAGGRCERCGADQLQGTGDRCAERGPPRGRSASARRRGACGAGRSAHAGRFAARGPLPVRRRPSRRCSASRSAARISRSSRGKRLPADAAPERLASWASMTCDRLPSSCLIVSVLRTSACRMRSSGRCV